jgi:hypothetical protein
MNRIKIISFIFLAVITPFVSRASVYQVGPGKIYTNISSLPRPLLAGDIVEIYYDPAYYKEAIKWTESGTIAGPIILMGMGSQMPVIDGTGVDVSGAGAVPRALFQFNGSNYIVENIAFQNAANGNNGAGIRITGGGDNITIKDCKITYCDMGMMSDGNGSMIPARWRLPARLYITGTAIIFIFPVIKVRYNSPIYTTRCTARISRPAAIMWNFFTIISRTQTRARLGPWTRQE